MRRAPVLLFAALSLVLTRPALAAPLDLTLTFNSLPSAQGFTYLANGVNAGVPETSVFSVDGTRLLQNTIGQTISSAGGGLYYQRLNGITTTEPKRILVSARCIATTPSSLATSGEGSFIFGFAHGSVQYAFGLTTTRVSVLQSTGTVLLPGTYDNTQFHDWSYEWFPGGSWSIRRDGVQIATGSGGGSLAINRVFFGDGTSGSNAQGEVRYYRFTQDLATPATKSDWSRVKALFR